jgi:murein DD-endopeptidase MepM/ murein hydrolase activator NlpD
VTVAIKLGWGGFVTTDLNFSEFVGADHTVAFRMMPQYPHGYPGAALASAGGSFYFVGQGLFDDTTRKPSFITALDDQRRDYPCELKPNVWHTVAVVRKGNHIRTYLQGVELTTPEGPLGLPATAPSGNVVLGRSDIWQFFGLIDELVVFTRALDLPEIKSLMTIANQDLLAVWSFPSVPSSVGALKFRRPIVLNGAAELVDTGAGAAADAKLLGPPSLQRPLHLPFATGEEWIVGQGFDERQGPSHWGMATFCLDVNRVDGKTRGTPVYAVAGGTVVKILESSPSGHLGKDALGHQISGNYIRVQHAAGEIGLYAHILQNSAVVAEGDVISVGQKIASAGDTGASENGPGNDHVHFDLSFLRGDLHSEPTGVTIPYAFRDYEVSTDQGHTWRYVPWGTPKAGERVRSLPKWTGWFGLGGAIKEAPAAVMPTTATEDIYARGTDDRLLQKWWTGTRWMPSDADWAPHDDGAFRLGSAPAVVTRDAIRDVYVRGVDGTLSRKFWNGETWSAWLPLGRPDGFVTIIGPPSVVQPTALTIDVYARGSDDRLYQKWWTGTQWMPPGLGWAQHDDGDFRLGSSPAVLTGGADLRDVYVRGRDGVVYHKIWDGHTWSPWLSLGGQIKGAPAVVWSAAGTPDIYVRGMDDRLYQKWWTGTVWTPDPGWLAHDETPEFVLGSSPSVVAGPANFRGIFVRGQNGSVFHKMFK